MIWVRQTYAQFLLSQQVYWRDVAFALVAAILPLGLGVAAVVSNHGVTGPGGLDLGAALVPGYMAFAMLWIIYNLINSATRRRDKLIYKRLRTSPISDSAILMGEALSGALMCVAQAAGLVVIAMLAIGAPAPRHGWLVAIGVVVGAVTLGLLSLGLSGVLPGAELSTWLMTPLIGLLAVGSGIMVPRSSFPHWLQVVTNFLPSTPFVELIQGGYYGLSRVENVLVLDPSASLGETFSHLGTPIGLACAWLGIGVLAAQKLFRWDPRRGRG